MKHSLLLVLAFITNSCISSNFSYKNYVSEFYSDKNKLLMEEEINKYMLNPTETLADIGTGDTFFACEIARKYPTMKFVLVDKMRLNFYDGKVREVPYIIDNNSSCTELKNRSSFVKGKSSTVPLKTDSHTQILLRRTFHELKYPTAIVNELKRILKPGGIVIVADYEPKFKGERDNGCRNQYIPEKDIISLFKGFKHLSTDYGIDEENKLYILRFQK
jgi:ubiquinone/menaquinone biosynthesis C-methylase UbiE